MSLATNALGVIQQSKSCYSLECGTASVPGHAKVRCTTATKNFQVDGKNDMLFGPQLYPTLSVSAINATATATAAEVVSGLITSTTGAAVSITLPTAALLMAAVPGCRVGTVVVCYIANLGGANAITILGGTGLTIDADNDTIAAGTGCALLIRFTVVTSGSETAIAYVC